MTTSKTKTAAAEIAQVVIDDGNRYLAFDTDGDWVVSFNCLGIPNQILVGYADEKIRKVKDLPFAVRTQILETEKNAGTALIRCAALKSYLVCGALGAALYEAINSKDEAHMAKTSELLVRARLAVGAAEIMAQAIGWEHQAFLLPAKKKEETTTAETTTAVTDTDKLPSPVKVSLTKFGGGVTVARIVTTDDTITDAATATTTATTTDTVTNTISCRACGKTGVAASQMRCSWCKKVTYCNIGCQGADWEKHRKDCKIRPKSSDSAKLALGLP